MFGQLQVLFYDADISSEPMTFRDVFLRSLALENLVTSFVSSLDNSDHFVFHANSAFLSAVHILP